MGDYNGTDGIRISDIKAIKIDHENKTVVILKEPVRVVICSELSKKENEYFSFIGHEGITYLKIYLEKRMKQGEVITSKSPLIAPSKPGIRYNSSSQRT